MIDVNDDYDSENLIPDLAEDTEEEHQLESIDNLSVNIPIILELNKAIIKGKGVAGNSKHQRTDTVEAKNNDETNIYSNPLQGYHLNASFLSRIWQIIHHLHSGLILYKTIFGGAIVSKEMYTKIPDCDSKCLAFLIHSTYDCAQRSSFITVLAQLCFLFPTVESVHNETEFISELVDGVADNKFLSRLQQRVGNSNPDKVDIIRNVFSFVKTIATTKKVRVKSRRNNSQFYQVVVASIFYEYLKFAGQRILSAIIFPPATKNKDDRINQQTSSVLRVAGTKRKRLISNMVRTNQYMTLQSQLCSPIEPDIESTLVTVQPEVCSF